MPAGALALKAQSVGRPCGVDKPTIAGVTLRVNLLASNNFFSFIEMAARIVRNALTVCPCFPERIGVEQVDK
jgi:hypothetical protein